MTPWSIAAVFGFLCFERLITGLIFIIDFFVPLIYFFRYLCMRRKCGVGPSMNGYILVRSSGSGKLGPQTLLSCELAAVRGLCLLRRSMNAMCGLFELLICIRYYCLFHSLIVELLFVELIAPI